MEKSFVKWDSGHIQQLLTLYAMPCYSGPRYTGILHHLGRVLLLYFPESFPSRPLIVRWIYVWLFHSWTSERIWAILIESVPLYPKMTHSDINETHCICFQTKNKLICVNEKIMTYIFLKILTFKLSHGRYYGHLTGVTQTFLEKSQKNINYLLYFLCLCDFMVRAQDFLSLFDHNITAHSIVIPINLGNHFHGRYHGRVLEC